MIPKGTWVQIHAVILNPEERTGNLPEETKRVPLEMWDKGFLLEAAEMGQTVSIKTVVGRIVSGTLVAQNPAFHHDYGNFVPELLQINDIIKATLKGEER